jgi:hypothetical protein
MRPITPLGLRHPVQVRYNYLSRSAWATYGFCVISYGSLIVHITMAQQAVPNLPPTVLKIVINHLAPHTPRLIGNLTHHTAR